MDIKEQRGEDHIKNISSDNNEDQHTWGDRKEK